MFGGPNAWIDCFGLLSITKLRFYSESMNQACASAQAWADLQMPLERAKRWDPLNRGVWVAGRVTLAGHPIGHPYVFQNNGEFIAGYLEMFFRNPHYFAAQNTELFQAFAQCLGQDPRNYWQEDFPYYVKQNRTYYLSGQRPPAPGIGIPK